jgi:hypothetical protein
MTILTVARNMSPSSVSFVLFIITVVAWKQSVANFNSAISLAEYIFNSKKS